MRPVNYLLLLLILALAAPVGAAERPEGTNCRLSAPPESAGEEFSHGAILRSYPRARDINGAYTGCQLMWAPDGAKWVIISATEVVRGDPVRIWSPHAGDPRLTACQYKNGRVISGVAETCAAPEFLVAKSLAPGCVKRLQEAVAAGGLGAPKPSGCEYE
jgi:hypothetical protein